MKHAVINSNGAVVNVIELEDGSDWTPPTGHTVRVWQRPESPTPTEPPVKTWSELEIKRKFTAAERIGIRAAAKTDAAVEDFMDMLQAATRAGGRIRADAPDFVSGLDYLVSTDLLAQARRDEILNS